MTSCTLKHWLIFKDENKKIYYAFKLSFAYQSSVLVGTIVRWPNCVRGEIDKKEPTRMVYYVNIGHRDRKF